MNSPESRDDSHREDTAEKLNSVNPDANADSHVSTASEPATQSRLSDLPEAGGSVVSGRFALLIMLLMVVLADATLYHAQGFTGPAVFLIGSALLVLAGIPNRSIRFVTLLIAALIVCLSVRLVCNGTALQIAAGAWLLSAWAVSLRGHAPFVLETLVFAAQCVPGGYDFFSRLNTRVRRSVLDPVDSGKPMKFLEVGLPLISIALFGSLFIMANPDIAGWVSGSLGDFVSSIRNFLVQFSMFEVVFWLFVAWLTGGLLRPLVSPLLEPPSVCDGAREPFETPLYSAFRNTLLTVIGLFGIYLVFETRAFMTRKPPEGFTYSSYAHEGAAWLTLALGLATLTLSMIFRGITLADPGLKKLQRLAWVWSSLNFLLALAVYNRMLIYIDFNGMTRMRVVGLLGITSVVVGFALVMVKIQRQQSFAWLLRRQLWVVWLAEYLYLVMPVDTLIHTYNVRQILSGNSAPIVQVTAHPVDDEALPVLLPLCQSNDALISQGVSGLLMTRFSTLEDQLSEADRLGWTAWQNGQVRCQAQLKESRPRWDTHANLREARVAFEQLQGHAKANWW